MTTLSLSKANAFATMSAASSAPSAPKKQEGQSAMVAANSSGLLTRSLLWLQAKTISRSREKRLQMLEMLQLGEKRFVALVQVEERHFLIGGGATNLAVIAEVGSNDTVEDLLKQRSMELLEAQEDKPAQPDFQMLLKAAESSDTEDALKSRPKVKTKKRQTFTPKAIPPAYAGPKVSQQPVLATTYAKEHETDIELERALENTPAAEIRFESLTLHEAFPMLSIPQVTSATVPEARPSFAQLTHRLTWTWEQQGATS